MEFFVYSVSDLNRVVKVTSSPNTRKTEDWTEGLSWTGFVIREKCTHIWVSK